MGDLLGSPRVALVFLLFRLSYSFFLFNALNVKAALACTAPGDPRTWPTALPFASLVRASGHLKLFLRAYDFGCDHTSTNAPDPIRTPQLSMLGR